MNFNKTNPYYNFEEKRQYDYECCNIFINKFSPRNRINSSVIVDKRRHISKVNLDPTFISFVERKFYFKAKNPIIEK